MPQAAQTLTDEHIGGDGLTGLAAKGRTGSWRQGLQLSDHLAHIFVVDTAGPAKRGQIATCQQV